MIIGKVTKTLFCGVRKHLKTFHIIYNVLITLLKHPTEMLFEHHQVSKKVSKTYLETSPNYYCVVFE